MIQSLSHAVVYVKDQQEALRFYTEKLGFEIRADVSVGDYRWLTVGPKDQPKFQLILSALKPGGNINEEAVKQYTKLQENGQLGGLIWETDNCQKTYEEMKAKGVEFTQPPTQQSYAIEAIWKDNSGNWFLLTQH